MKNALVWKTVIDKNRKTGISDLNKTIRKFCAKIKNNAVHKGEIAPFRYTSIALCTNRLFSLNFRNTLYFVVIQEKYPTDLNSLFSLCCQCPY